MTWRQGGRIITGATGVTGDGKGRLEQVFEMRNQTGLGDAQDWTVEIFTPSSRLHVGFEVFYETTSEDESEISTYGVSSLWTLTAAAFGKKAGRSFKLHDLTGEVNQALPRSYEASSAVKIIRIFAGLDDVEDSGGASVDGTWFVRAYWEPNIEMSDDELNKLFAECAIRRSNTQDQGA